LTPQTSCSSLQLAKPPRGHDPMSTSKLARFERSAHRITATVVKALLRGAATKKVQCRGSRDATRLAYVEVARRTIRRRTTVGFLARAVEWFSDRGSPVAGILSDNGPPIAFDDWRKACRALDLKPIANQALTPPQNQNGKANGFIKTCCRKGPM